MKKNKREKKRKKNYCAKCWDFTETENHHVLPRRNFRMREYHRKTIRLCEDCHKQIELILPKRKLSVDTYIEIHQLWLKGAEITVV